MTQLYLNDAAWDLGNEVGASIWQGVVFFWFTGISWGKSKSLPSYKLEAMTLCKLETWVLYKVAACKSQGIYSTCTKGCKSENSWEAICLPKTYLQRVSPSD